MDEPHDDVFAAVVAMTLRGRVSLTREVAMVLLVANSTWTLCMMLTVTTLPEVKRL